MLLPNNSSKGHRVAVPWAQMHLVEVLLSVPMWSLRARPLSLTVLAAAHALLTGPPWVPLLSMSALAEVP